MYFKKRFLLLYMLYFKLYKRFSHNDASIEPITSLYIYLCLPFLFFIAPLLLCYCKNTGSMTVVSLYYVLKSLLTHFMILYIRFFIILANIYK